MRGSRAAALVAGAALLASCGSADDLKARWLVLPEPPATAVRDGLGTGEITEIDLSTRSYRLADITVLDAFDSGITPERSYPPADYAFEFVGGEAQLDLGEDATRKGVATITLTFGPADVFYSDANGDGYQDAMIVLDQTVSYYSDDGARDRGAPSDETSTQSLLLLTYAEESIGDIFYVNTGPLASASARDTGFSVTTEPIGGLTDTIDLGWPEGIPVRIDEFGGAITCTHDVSEIDFDAVPTKANVLTAAPDASEIAGYDEYALFPLPADPQTTNMSIYAGYERKVFLLDGGDMTRWTDYRCGWTATSGR